jgi:hypothetical protein
MLERRSGSASNANTRTDRKPKDRLIPFIELHAARLMPKDAKSPPVDAIEEFKSTIQQGLRGAEALAPLPAAYWRDTLSKFRTRLAQQRRPSPARRAWSPRSEQLDPDRTLDRA